MFTVLNVHCDQEWADGHDPPVAGVSGKALMRRQQTTMISIN